jgi:hypothetical protein
MEVILAPWNFWPQYPFTPYEYSSPPVPLFAPPYNQNFDPVIL